MFFDVAILSRLIDDLPTALCTSMARHRLQSVIRRFPLAEPWGSLAARTGIIGFEFRLAEDDDQVDVALPLTSEDAEMMVRLWDHSDGAWLKGHPQLYNLIRFFRFWVTKEAGWLLTDSRLAWLEFDILRGDTADQLASKVFVQLKNSANWPPALAGEWLGVYFDEVFSLLTDLGRPSKALHDRFQMGVSSLPERAYPRYFGVTLPLATPAYIRVSYRGIFSDALTGWLEEIGIPKVHADTIGKVAVALSSDKTEFLTINVDYDLSGNARPVVGLEFFARADVSENDFWAESVLERLQMWHLCSAIKSGALARFGGAETEMAVRQQQFVRTRKVNHVKVSVGPDGPVEAKAYAGQTLFGGDGFLF